MLVWPASFHKGFELAGRKKSLTNQLKDKWMDRGDKKARYLQGKKVIHSFIQVNIYLLNIYNV